MGFLFKQCIGEHTVCPSAKMTGVQNAATTDLHFIPSNDLYIVFSYKLKDCHFRSKALLVNINI